MQCQEWFQELVKTGFPSPPGRALFPAPVVVFIHSPKVMETKNSREPRERDKARAVTCIFSFHEQAHALRAAGQTPGSLDFPVKEAHGDLQSREGLAEAGPQPPACGLT